MFKRLLFLLFLILLMNCSKDKPNAETQSGSHKKIDSLINAATNESISDSLRSQFLVQANNRIENVENESYKINAYISTGYYNLLLGNLDAYGKTSHLALKIALRKGDTINLARFYYDLGYYYRLKFKPDSSYFFSNRALKMYTYLNDDINQGKILLNMAVAQTTVKDYTGSEINTIKSISKLKNSNQYPSLYLSYNNLGVVYINLGQYDDALENYFEAKSYLKKYDASNYYKAMSLNNIGRVYYKKKDYPKAIEYYNQAMEINDLMKTDPGQVATVIANIADAKFEMLQLDGISELYFKSLRIRDSLKIKDGQVVVNIKLSKYFLTKFDTLKGILHAKKAEIIAKETKFNEGLLESYLQLSNIYSDKTANEYLLKYIKLSDSLVQNERSIREKFTRIAYETDEIIKEKESETKKKWWFLILAIIGAVFSLLLYLILRQRAKTRELVFSKKQDEANIEIYNLMLSKQRMFQKGSENEKNRISEELHDGILGRMFGTRLNLESLNEGDSKSDISEREKCIEEFQLIEADIRKISHDLKSNQLDSGMSYNTMVEELLKNQSKVGRFDYHLNFNDIKNWDSISNKIKINCYRTLQECLHNIHKYAKASKVDVEFKIEGRLLSVQIKDDGLGFDTRKKFKGIGLKNMKTRADSLNGSVEIISKSGQGTLIKMRIPFKN